MLTSFPVALTVSSLLGILAGLGLGDLLVKDPIELIPDLYVAEDEYNSWGAIFQSPIFPEFDTILPA